MEKTPLPPLQREVQIHLPSKSMLDGVLRRKYRRPMTQDWRRLPLAVGPLRGSASKNTRLLVRTILVVALILGQPLSVAAQIAQTNRSIFAELPFAETVNREVDFAQSILEHTNKNFDQKIYTSVRTNGNKPIVISYHLVSFIFYYPTGVTYVRSTTEMAQPDELVCEKGNVVRRPTTNEIPANWVRVLDTRRKSVGADLDLLLGVAPLEKPEDVTYVRRSFRFVFQNGWKEES